MTELHTIHILNKSDLQIDKREVLRYLRVSKSDAVTDAMVDDYIEEVYKIITPKAVYTETNLQLLNDVVRFDFMEIKSHSLSANLEGCTKAYFFVATLGVELDREIEKYSKFLQSKSTIYHAIGSALIESFCDYITNTLTENQQPTRRFSPGYGDLSLEYQRQFLKSLDAHRKIGIALSDSLLMIPSKSVTAIIGIK